LFLIFLTFVAIFKSIARKRRTDTSSYPTSYWRADSVADLSLCSTWICGAYSWSNSQAYCGSDKCSHTFADSGSDASAYTGSNNSSYPGSDASAYTGSNNSSYLGSDASAYSCSNNSSYSGSDASAYSCSNNSSYSGSDASAYSCPNNSGDPSTNSSPNRSSYYLADFSLCSAWIGRADPSSNEQAYISSNSKADTSPYTVADSRSDERSSDFSAIGIAFESSSYQPSNSRTENSGTNKSSFLCTYHGTSNRFADCSSFRSSYAKFRCADDSADVAPNDLPDFTTNGHPYQAAGNAEPNKCSISIAYEGADSCSDPCPNWSSYTFS
jgi:hypothetical protein